MWCDAWVRVGLQMSMVGPIAWMPPEALRDAKYHRKSDTYMYACVVYEMITGHAPWKGFSGLDVAKRVVNRRETLDSHLPDNMYLPLRRLLRDCWLYDYHARPTMADVKVLLEEMCKALFPGDDTSSDMPVCCGRGSPMTSRHAHPDPYRATAMCMLGDSSPSAMPASPWHLPPRPPPATSPSQHEQLTSRVSAAGGETQGVPATPPVMAVQEPAEMRGRASIVQVSPQLPGDVRPTCGGAGAVTMESGAASPRPHTEPTPCGAAVGALHTHLFHGTGAAGAGVGTGCNDGRLCGRARSSAHHGGVYQDFFAVAATT